MQKLAVWFFLLLFPGLFFYSSAVGARLIPPLIGGGFGLAAGVTLVALLPACAISAVKLSDRRAAFVTLMFFALVIYTAAWVLAHYLLGSSAQGRSDVLAQYLTLVGTWLALFSLGYFWPSFLSRRYKMVLLACSAVILAIVILNIDLNRLIFVLGVTEAEGAISYQGFARSAAITGLVLLACLRELKHIAVVGMALLLTLFMIGARSEMVGVVSVAPFLVYLHFREKPVATLAVTVFSGLIILASLVYSYDELSVSRQFQLLNISESSSGRARSAINDQAVSAIAQSPILGDYAGHATRDGVGNYAHNVLSSWRQLGIAGFVLYLSLLVSAVVLSIKRIKSGDRSDLARTGGCVSVFCLVLALGAKSFFWPFPALAWGLVASTYRRRAPV